MDKKGKLIIIGTPIGNMSDVNDLTRKALSECDILYCEDTRQTMKILNHFKIKVPKMISYREQNENYRAQEGIKLILEGNIIGLVSDSGMPLISDPGYRIVRGAVDNYIDIDIVPNHTAFLYALLKSGLGNDNFYFIGFFPKKLKKQIEILEMIRENAIILIFYESPMRIRKTLSVIKENVDNGEIAVCRELTKINEEVIRSRIAELDVDGIKVKGEFTVVLKVKK